MPSLQPKKKIVYSMTNLLQRNHILTLSNIPTYFFHQLPKWNIRDLDFIWKIPYSSYTWNEHSIAFEEFNLKLIYLTLMFKFMRFHIKSFLYCNKFRVDMIIIKTETSVGKINRVVLGLVLSLSLLSSEDCSKEREKIK